MRVSIVNENYARKNRYMMQDTIKKKSNRKSTGSIAPTHKRVRLSHPQPPKRKNDDTKIKSFSLPPLPPLKSITDQTPTLHSTQTTDKLAELRQKFLEDITMVVQKLKNVLTFCPGSACLDSPVSPSTVLKLVRTVQTLEKLRGLLLLNPVRLRNVSLTLLDTVEQQIKTNLLPLATLIRSFEGKQIQGCNSLQGAAEDTAKTEQGWSENKSPRSPSGLAVESSESLTRDWRFLSMALSLHL
ncbi:hypothetical protein BBO99_00007327 [Phytophthora kernoviae]|uniref:Uncharacterized protein n=2 Tax=Phytophthora kernoviae TaxID=325452 RepID=A0A3R7KGZ0_9STRA|nr:hypothetical protein G195_008348 [Phytophthora kernoviae 00238/432]KAG2519849.1 hypothetical protein JM16_006947 [Phytophthora kernoviae]KAG2521048.1 hypothetical protein JM18_006777 [Phytophthora kernoviae]RLN27134.1 hypothetical protein BBI17_007274 [Phytophthora kernoviae]RLN76722.1 hypothetical protein BBO99_00007327 [Phytophthora kernoviae]